MLSELWLQLNTFAGTFATGEITILDFVLSPKKHRTKQTKKNNSGSSLSTLWNSSTLIAVHVERFTGVVLESDGADSAAHAQCTTGVSSAVGRLSSHTQLWTRSSVL